MKPTSEQLSADWFKFKDIALQHPHGSKTFFKRYLYLLDDVFTQETWAFHVRKSDIRPVYALIIIRNEKDACSVSSALYENNFYGGYVFRFDEKNILNDGYYPLEIFSASRLSDSDIVLKSSSLFRYIDVSEFIDIFYYDLIKGIQLVRSFPHQCELAIKLQHPEFMKDKRWLKLSKPDMIQILEYLRLAGRSMDYNSVKYNLKRHIKPQDALTLYELKCLTRMQHRTCLPLSDVKVLSSYLRRQKATLEEWLNYKDARSRLYLDTSFESMLPHDLASVYDELFKKLNNDNKQFIEQSLKALPFSFAKQFNDYGLFIPCSIVDFATIGNSLHNCVGTMHYEVSMAKRQDLIIGIMKDDQLYACVEFAKAHSKVAKVAVLQLYKKYNSAPDTHLKQFVYSQLLPCLKDYPFLEAT